MREIFLFNFAVRDSGLSRLFRPYIGKVNILVSLPELARISE